MEMELRDELEVPGHVVMIQVKSKTQAEWIKQANDAMAKAEAYGATKPNEMRQPEKGELSEALTALRLMG